jgi:hypothetical protein
MFSLRVPVEVGVHSDMLWVSIAGQLILHISVEVSMYRAVPLHSLRFSVFAGIVNIRNVSLNPLRKFERHGSLSRFEYHLVKVASCIDIFTSAHLGRIAQCWSDSAGSFDGGGICRLVPCGV